MAIYIYTYVPGVVYVKGSNDVYPHTRNEKTTNKRFGLYATFPSFRKPTFLMLITLNWLNANLPENGNDAVAGNCLLLTCVCVQLLSRACMINPSFVVLTTFLLSLLFCLFCFTYHYSKHNNIVYDDNYGSATNIPDRLVLPGTYNSNLRIYLLNCTFSNSKASILEYFIIVYLFVKQTNTELKL
ncbi:hypothetical protein QTP88_022554 [Uroleucon formosanum]